MTKNFLGEKKRDLYRDETDGDFAVYGPRLTDTIQEPEFIMRDDVNFSACNKLKLKGWLN